jgi:hypothetical protein
MSTTAIAGLGTNDRSLDLNEARRGEPRILYAQ